MDTERHNLKALVGESLLELLHRELDGDLTPDQQQQLDERKDDSDVQAARAALRRAVMFLSGPNPPALPRSVAADVAAEVALSRALALTSPSLPRSLASSVAAEVALSRQLAAPLLPKLVAAAVASDIGLAGQLATPPLPRSVAAAVTAEIAAAKALGTASPPLPRASVAAAVASRVAAEQLGAPPPASLPQIIPSQPQEVAVQTLGLQAAPLVPAMPSLSPLLPKNPAPLLLVGALLLGLTLLALTTAWPNLAAGAVVLRSLLAQVSPLAGAGLALLLLTSALITWKPTPALRTAGAGAFALAAVLTLPALYNVAGGGHGLSIGRNVTVNGQVQGNVIAIGGNVYLKPEAQVQGEVVTLMGDVHREEGAKVSGRVNALLGHAPGDAQAIQTTPISDLSLATAAAFRPVLGWLGGAAWPQIFVALTGSLLLLMFLAGMAPTLAQRQRHAPMRTLALGVLLLAALILPAAGLALVGLLGPALIVAATTALLIAAGLSVSVYDMGRALAYRVRLPVPDAVGALLGLSTFAASLSYAPLAFALALVGGAWGAGTLLLTRQRA